MTCTRGLDRLGWDESWSDTVRTYGRCGQPARVVSTDDEGISAVLGADGLVRTSLGGAALAKLAEDPDQAPCPGDWVVVRLWPDGPATVELVLPRHNTVRSLVAGGASGPAMAANVDLVVVVLPIEQLSAATGGPDAPRGLPPRGGDIPTVVVAAEGRSAPSGAGAPDWSGAHGVEVLRWNPKSSEGMARLRQRLHGDETALLVGAPRLRSGLLAAMTGAIPVPQRSPPGGTDRLVVVPGGGCLIDLSRAGVVQTGRTRQDPPG
jgi:ribosome biogenesis GTPase